MIEIFPILKGWVITLGIGATLMMLFAIAHAAATSPGRKPEYRLVCRLGKLFAWGFLSVLVVLDMTLGLRSSVVGFAGSTATGSVTTAYMSIINYIAVYSLAVVYAAVLYGLSERGRGSDPESVAIAREARHAEIELERRRRERRRS